MGCCCSTNTVLAELAAKIQAELEGISEVFPGTDLVCVLGAPPTSELLAQWVDPTQQTTKAEELVPLFTHLKRVANHFANTLETKSVDCNMIHIKGEKSIFSCYNVGSNLLCFYSHLPPELLDTIDLASCDKAMAPKVERLQQLLKEYAASTGRKGA